MNIYEMVASLEREHQDASDRLDSNRQEIEAILATAESQKREYLTKTEDRDCERLHAAAKKDKAELAVLERKLERAKAVGAEEDAMHGTVNGVGVSQTPNGGFRAAVPLNRQTRSYQTAELHVGSEPHTYSRENDVKGNGTPFLTDVIGAYRGNPQANERLARHMREWEVDNKGRQTRAAGDVTTGSLPNLIVPQYLVNLYAAKPSAARPFADIMRHEDLPAEGMKVELAKGNTSATAALQTTELVAAGGGNFDADPLELSVQTAEAWQLVSRQSLDRGRVTENVVVGDMLDQMHALIDSTLITQATTGLYDSGTRIDYASASPTMAELYPLILQGASKVSQTLLNRGKPTHVLMHPRRWYWLQSLVASTWPQVSQPGLDPQAMGMNTGNGYDDGIAGVLPCGLKVVMDANVPTAALAGAQTGGTQDIVFVLPQSEAILFEPANREVFIRAEAPAASQLGVMLVVYEYFAYTFSRYASTAFQRINGTGTVPPAGF